jgi:NAD(P)-dependent dehydrogenase (short-subunit alcohol dehydrogenase family)
MTKPTSTTAIVTGGGSGIGAAIAQTLASDGARVVIAGRRAEPLREVADAIAAAGATALPFPIDLATADGPARLVDAAMDAFGGVDMLVNNAAPDLE